MLKTIMIGDPRQLEQWLRNDDDIVDGDMSSVKMV
jgi:hypothetical protein